MNSAMLIVLTVLAFASSLTLASAKDCDGVLNSNLGALLEPRVFDRTRLIMVEMNPADINAGLLANLQVQYVPKLATANRTVGVRDWDRTEYLFSTGPFGKNAFTDISIGQLGSFEAPFQRMDSIQAAYDRTKSYDILFVVLNPHKDVYETTLIDDLLIKRNWSYRQSGVRQSTVVIGPPGFGGRAHQWSISFLDRFEYLDATQPSPQKIINPSDYPLDIDTYVFPTHRWEGND